MFHCPKLSDYFFNDSVQICIIHGNDTVYFLPTLPSTTQCRIFQKWSQIPRPMNFLNDLSSSVSEALVKTLFFTSIISEPLEGHLIVLRKTKIKCNSLSTGVRWHSCTARAHHRSTSRPKSCSSDSGEGKKEKEKKKRKRSFWLHRHWKYVILTWEEKKKKGSSLIYHSNKYHGTETGCWKQKRYWIF